MPKPRNRPRSSAKPQHPVPRWAVRLSATAASPTQLTRALNADLSRPTARFDDPILRQHAYRIHHVGLNAYLMALAAWQRGLKVTFHYEVATKCERFANAAVQGFRGELFSVSDGRKTHFFCRTLGDLTSRKLSQLCDNKQATKQRLIEQGIEVPDGILVDKQALDQRAIEAFLAQHPDKRFHLKPLDGTLGEGTHGHLTAVQVMACIAEHPKSRLLLEEHTAGTFLRINVVDGRYAGAYAIVPPSVVGNGRSTIAELVDAKNQSRRHQPLHPGRVIRLEEREQDYLATQGLRVDSIPAEGESVLLNQSLKGEEGADVLDASHTSSETARTLAMRACQALRLPVGGIDLLVDDVTGRHVVLEANQCPMLKGNVFPFYGPSPGNRVAEAIIDHYFPDSIDHHRHTEASFDFMQVCQTLQSGLVGDITLPVLGPDWVHRRFSIAATQVDERTVPAIHRAMFTYGIHAQLIKSDVGDLIVDVVAPKGLYTAFMAALKRKHT